MKGYGKEIAEKAFVELAKVVRKRFKSDYDVYVSEFDMEIVVRLKQGYYCGSISIVPKAKHTWSDDWSRFKYHVCRHYDGAKDVRNDTYYKKLDSALEALDEHMKYVYNKRRERRKQSRFKEVFDKERERLLKEFKKSHKLKSTEWSDSEFQFSEHVKGKAFLDGDSDKDYIGKELKFTLDISIPFGISYEKVKTFAEKYEKLYKETMEGKK